MTAKSFRSSAAWQRARARVLRGARVCSICGGALRFDVHPRHRLAPSVDHVRPLRQINLNTAEGRALAVDPAWLRATHLGCNAARGAGGRRRRRRVPAPQVWNLNEVAREVAARRASVEAQLGVPG